MATLTYLLTGGFAKGYRTYIMAGVALVGVVAQFSVGDLSLIQAVQQGALALGLGALRAA
jgi:hypothetical protein